MRVSKTYRTETAHRLLNYEGPCANIHGHSYLWEVTVEGMTDPSTGMIIDFKDLKGYIQTVLDMFDHTLVLNNNDPLTLMGNSAIEYCTKVFQMAGNPTAENFARYVGKKIQETFNNKNKQLYKVVAVKCHETTTSYAEWVPEETEIPHELSDS